jgi:hypothetical protein
MMSTGGEHRGSRGTYDRYRCNTAWKKEESMMVHEVNQEREGTGVATSFDKHRLKVLVKACAWNP